MNKTLLPKLRFPEFQDAPKWETKPLIEVCIKITQGGTPDTSIPDFWNGSIEWLTPAEMGKTETRFIDSTNRKITEEGLRNCSSDLLPVNSIILSTRAPIGHLAINTSPMAINQGCKGLIPNASTNYDFLYYSLFNSKTFLIDLGAGNTFKELSGNSLKSFEMMFPKTVEQQKIADCLTSLDDLIAAQSQKVDALQAYKKGLLQNLFPAEGESVPRLRFPEFESAGEWEEKTISDLDIYVSDGNYGEMYPRAEEMKESGVPFIRANNIKDSRLVWDDMKYIGADLHEVLESGHLEENDILVTTRGNIGMIAYVTSEFHGANINAQICLLRCGKSLNSRYLLQYLLSENCHNQFMALQTGSALKQLPKKNLGRIKISLPLLPEQQRIAELLGAVDEEISAQGEAVAALKVHKRGLMQGLFP